MIEYIYFVKCPNCEDEPFNFFDKAKEFACGCLSQKPIITQVEVNRNDFGECIDSADLGTVWSWEDMMSDTEKEPTAEPSLLTKDFLNTVETDTDPEFDALDNSVEVEDDDFRAINDEELYEAFVGRLSGEADEIDMIEFTELCKEIGIETVSDLDYFIKKEAGRKGTLLDKLKSYRAELGADFKLKEESLNEGFFKSALKFYIEISADDYLDRVSDDIARIFDGKLFNDSRRAVSLEVIRDDIDYIKTVNGLTNFISASKIHLNSVISAYNKAIKKTDNSSDTIDEIKLKVYVSVDASLFRKGKARDAQDMLLYKCDMIMRGYSTAKDTSLRTITVKNSGVKVEDEDSRIEEVSKVLRGIFESIDNITKNDLTEAAEERLATNNKGDYLVKASSNLGYTVFNSHDVAIGGFSGDDDTVAIARFEKGDITESCRKPVPEGMTLEQLVETMEENEDMVECTWCNELFPKDECRKEVDLGYLCSRCEAAIKSRGEDLTFRENNYWDFLDEEVDPLDHHDPDYDEDAAVDYIADQSDRAWDSRYDDAIDDFFNEDFGDPVDFEDEESEEEPEESIFDNAESVEEVVDILVKDEEEAIAAYEEAADKIEELASEEDIEETKEILDHIKEEEEEHIEELESLLPEETEEDENETSEISVEEAFKPLSLCPECGAEKAFDHEAGVCNNCGFII